MKLCGRLARLEIHSWSAEGSRADFRRLQLEGFVAGLSAAGWITCDFRKYNSVLDLQSTQNSGPYT